MPLSPISLAAYGVFAVVSLIHLYGTYKRNSEIRILTKGLLLPLLMIAYCCTVKDQDFLVLAALFFCWIGDVLLMKKTATFLTLGGISFFFAHIFLIIIYSRNIKFNSLPLFIIIPAYLIFLGIAVIVLLKLWNRIPKPLKFTSASYIFANATMNIFALMQYVNTFRPAFLIISAGSVLFFISDLLLYNVRFHGGDSIYKKHTLEMFTYLAGEALICLGLML